MDPKLTPLSDKALLAGCVKGDSRCREVFVRQYSGLVFATIQRALKIKNVHLSQQSVEDLHQTAFLFLFEHDCRKLKQYKGKNGCSLASWIRMLTGRMVLDHLRRGADVLAHRHQAQTVELASELCSPQPSMLERLTDAEQWHQIERGLKQLEPRDRLVIQLHCLEGRPLAKVAQATGISMKNIHSVKHRAIQRLKAVVVGGGR